MSATARALVLLALLVLLAHPIPAARAEAEVVVLRAEEGCAAAVLYVPERFPRTEAPLLVALHPEGVTAEEWVHSVAALADEGRYLLLCPQAAGPRFQAADLPGLIERVRRTRKDRATGAAHLLGVTDSGYQAMLFAFAEADSFRSVISLGADAPLAKPGRGGSSLRVLVMKGISNRPASGRESILALRERVEVAEFKAVPGPGLVLDAPARAYLVHFLDAAAGRVVAGQDRSLAWRELARGMAQRGHRKCPALVYLYDEAPEHARRTALIQTKILFDPRVREAAADLVPIMAPRADAEKVAPSARLVPGPALIVLDAEGKVAGVLQRKVSAAALAAILASL